MINLAPFVAVFALGLRHGADPDHLAAIDNLTRNSFARNARASKFIGTLFAAGHMAMVLSISMLVGAAGAALGRHGALIERIGTIVSIAVLVLIALANLRQLRGGAATVGVRFKLLPRALRESTHPLIAIPVGLLFGLGFETSSQIATYALAIGVNAGILGALAIGGAFSIGMIATDTLDSVLVHRLISTDSSRTPAAVRVWIWSVTLVALAVAALESAQLFGWMHGVSDLYVSIGIVVLLLATFLYVFIATRSPHPSNHTSSQPRGVDIQ